MSTQTMKRIAQIQNDIDILEKENEFNKSSKDFTQSESFERLLKNPDFQKVIMEWYIQDEAVRYVSLLATPPYTIGENSEKGRASLISSLSGISELGAWLSNKEGVKEAKLQKISENETRIDGYLKAIKDLRKKG